MRSINTVIRSVGMVNIVLGVALVASGDLSQGFLTFGAGLLGWYLPKTSWWLDAE